ncbi:MAG: ABC transporter ATPase, partial [Acidobacteria bacterium]|nr:ABC transporter ATPase [Acidobacteriota bacterium]
MSYVPFTSLAPTAKTWIFGAGAPLDVNAQQMIRAELELFIHDWSVHGSDLPSSFELQRDRFLIVAADDAAEPGGCSVDRLFRLVSALEARTNVSLLDSSLVFFEEGNGEVRSATR